MLQFLQCLVPVFEHLVVLFGHAVIHGRRIGVVPQQAVVGGIGQCHLQGIVHHLGGRILFLGTRHGVGEEYIHVAPEECPQHLLLFALLSIRFRPQAVEEGDALLRSALALVGVEQLHHDLGQELPHLLMPCML